MDFEIERPQELKSLMELRRKFFKYHTQIINNRSYACEPNALVLNPEQFISCNQMANTELWIAVYCRGYYVSIEQSVLHPIHGPHVAKLNLQIQTRNIWLGTAQMVRSFFDIKEIAIGLRKALRTREYYCSEESERGLVDVRLTEYRSSSLGNGVSSGLGKIQATRTQLIRGRTLVERLRSFHAKPKKNLARDLKEFHALYHGKRLTNL